MNHLPVGDGESSGDEEQVSPQLRDGGVWPPPEEDDYYSVSKVLVEKKRALMRQSRNSPKAPSRAKKQTVQSLYSSFVPVFALKRLRERPEDFRFSVNAPAAVVLTRVDGLTTIIRRANSQITGPNRLCSELDRFFGGLAEAAADEGGDLVKVVGNTILLLFNVEGTSIQSLDEATLCAARFATKVRDAFPDLGLRSSMGRGSITCVNIAPDGPDGHPAYAEIVVVGKALEQATRALFETEANDVVCSSAAWTSLKTAYEGDFCGDALIRIGNAITSDDKDEYESFGEVEGSSSDVSADEDAIARSLPGGHEHAPPTSETTKSHAPGIDLRKLTLFIPRSFDRALRFRYSYASCTEHRKMSEVRDVTVCSLRVCCFDLDLFQEIVSCVYSTVEQMHGTPMKFSCDDQGLHLLLCFGLPGSVYEQSATRALAAVFLIKDRLCSQRLLGDRCRQYPRIKDRKSLRVMAGVATSWAFCGVVGSSQRMDYIVIGDAVDKAQLLEQACGHPRMPEIVSGGRAGNIVLECGTTVLHTKHEVTHEECRADELPIFAGASGRIRIYAPLGWRERHAVVGAVPTHLISSQKARNRQVAAVFENQRRGETCVIGGGWSAASARVFADESVPILSRFHKATLLRTNRSKSAYEDGALGLCTVGGAWRSPVATALDVIETSMRRRRRSFGNGMRHSSRNHVRSPRRSPGRSPSPLPREREPNNASFTPRPTSPHLSLRSQPSSSAAWSRRWTSTSQRGAMSPPPPQLPQSGGGSRSPDSLRDKLMRGRSLGHLLSGKRPAITRPCDENDVDGWNKCGEEGLGSSLVGRTSAVLSSLPTTLHKYASVLNDMYMPEERNAELGDERIFADVSPMMRRARLVQIVVLIILQASKRSRLTLLLDNLDQMDDTSWDILYKLTQWQKKVANGTLPHSTNKRASSMSRMASFLLKGSFGTASESTTRLSKAQTDGVDLLQYSCELMSSHPFLAFVVAPYSSATGVERAEWQEIRRLSRDANTYIELAKLSAHEARLFAAERLKLCNAESTDEAKEVGVKLVSECPMLDELVASSLGDPETLASILSEAKNDHIKVIIATPPKIEVSDDLDAMELPLAYAASRLAMVDELPLWRQQLLFAASVFKKEFTPELLVNIVLDEMDLKSVAALCEDLCVTTESSGGTIFSCSRGSGCFEYGHDGFVPCEDNEGVFCASGGDIYAFAEPLVQRALASKLTESQITAVFRRAQALTTKSSLRLDALISPYLVKKHTALLEACEIRRKS